LKDGGSKGHALLYGLIAVMVAFWSGNFIVGKVALREFPPLLLAGLRVTVAGVFMLPAYWWEGRRTADRWGWSDVPILVYLGLFGVALNQLFFVLGLSRTSVAHSAIIVGLTPIQVLFIASMMRMEKLTARKITGLLIALAGVAILKTFEVKGNGQGPTWTGDIFAFLAGLVFALFTVFGKRVTKRHTAITVNTFGYIGGALALAPVTLWQGWAFDFARVTLAGWLAVVYMALFSSVICYLIYYYALMRIPASRVSAFSYLQPLMATLMGVVILDEHITLPLMVGGTVIFSGVWLTERG
jgi:drug/metabolite transporter (DMT)-like permease